MTWPLSDAGLVTEGGAVTASSVLTTVTAHATPNTKGTWVELVASAPYPASEILICATGVHATGVDTSSLIDIGIGGSGSEIAVVSNIPVGYTPSATGLPNRFRLPLHVPPGSRVSACMASAVTSQAITLAVHLLGGGLNGTPGYGRATTYGAATASSTGTSLTAPGSTNTKSAWTQITASTTNTIRALTACAVQRSGDTTLLSRTGLIDIGVGGAGSEQVLIPNMPFIADAAEWMTCPAVTIPANLPPGTRLAARSQATSTTDLVGVVIIGFD